jgi:hypothetical protein
MPRKRKSPGLDLLRPLRFSVPEAWTQLPVLDNWAAVARDPALVAWARRQARAMLGADATPEQVAGRAATLTALTYAARAQGVHYSLAFFAADPYELAGTLNVRQVIADRKGQRLSPGRVRQAFGQPPGGLPGKLEDAQVEEVEADLPSGPALRIVRRETRRDERTDQVWHPETVVWTVWPPNVGDAVVLVFLWSFSYPPEFRDQLARMAEGVAASVVMEPPPAAPTATPPSGLSPASGE